MGAVIGPGFIFGLEVMTYGQQTAETMQTPGMRGAYP